MRTMVSIQTLCTAIMRNRLFHQRISCFRALHCMTFFSAIFFFIFAAAQIAYLETKIIFIFSFCSLVDASVSHRIEFQTRTRNALMPSIVNDILLVLRLNAHSWCLVSTVSTMCETRASSTHYTILIQ